MSRQCPILARHSLEWDIAETLSETLFETLILEFSSSINGPGTRTYEICNPAVVFINTCLLKFHRVHTLVHIDSNLNHLQTYTWRSSNNT
jgi:hypothetical protein